MSSVTIDGGTYEVLGTLAQANTYLRGSIDYRARWIASSADQQGLAMVYATRVFERLPWAPGVVPGAVDDIVNASYELAGFRLVKVAGMGGPGGGSTHDGMVSEVQDTTRRVKFYFSAMSARARASLQEAIPRDILALIMRYLSRAASTGGAPTVTGADGVSEFTDDKKFALT